MTALDLCAAAVAAYLERESYVADDRLVRACLMARYPALIEDADGALLAGLRPAVNRGMTRLAIRYARECIAAKGGN